MTAPLRSISITDRERLRALAWEARQVVPAGRVMLCKGQRVVGYCDVGDLANAFTIANQASLVCLSPADFADVKRWLK